MPSASSFFCMLFVSQKIHIKRSPNAIKIYGELFWNICDFWDLESMQTEAHSAQETPGHAPGSRRVVVGCPHLIRRLGLYFGRKEAYIQKNHVKISVQLELWISQNIRNGFGQIWGARNRREQRGRSNLGGAPAPLPPWRTWNKGGTLLPSRE